MESEIANRVRALLQRVKSNPFGEKVTVVAAVKTRTAEEIEEAISAGITDVGENRVREFCEKFDAARGARRHFIGRLQTNKVKYLIGKADLIQSLDRDELAFEIARQSKRAETETSVLIELNLGEAQKAGYPLERGVETAVRISRIEGLRVEGFMAMLPLSSDEGLLGALCDGVRRQFEAARREIAGFCHLSMGMSGDYELCIAHGSNMIRPGVALFGARREKV